MKIVLAAATNFEIAPFRELLTANANEFNKHKIQTLITGVGLVNTTFALTSFLNIEQPDLIIQAGIGGSFEIQYPLASTWLINKEYFGDLGVQENNQFFDMFDKGFIHENEFPFSKNALKNIHLSTYNTIGFPSTTGISVNEISTAPIRIQQLKDKYQPGIESMEGAAFHFVALQKNIPFLQMRSVSNFVGERNKEFWNIKEAILNLNISLQELISSL